MRQRRFVLAMAAVLCAVLGAGVAVAQEPTDRPQVRNVTLDPASGVLTVVGTGFGLNPIVTLDGQRLALVAANTDTVISVIAPESVLSAPGTYRLTVVDLERNVGDAFIVAVPLPSAIVGASGGAASATTRSATSPATPSTTSLSDSITSGAEPPVSPTFIETGTSAALGVYALDANTTGVSNAAVGYSALTANNTGSYNTGMGAWTLGDNTIGENNAALGISALRHNIDGNNNVGIGFWALGNNLQGNDNAAIGNQALINSTGSENTAVGYGAGTNATTGSWNIYFGAQVSGVAAEHNVTRIGNPCTPTGLFTATGQCATYVSGIRSVSVTGALPVVIDANGRLGTADNSGNFGIGTAAPVTTLDVKAAAGIHLGVRTGEADATAVQLNAYNDGGAANIPMEFKATRFNFTPGNVGIGTTAPGSRLDVRGEIGSGDGTLKNVVSYARYLDNPVGVFGTLSGHDLQVWANGSPQMAVTAAGNVGIGTVSPQYKLHVFGSIYATGSYLGSDRRLKRDVQDLRYGLREVLRLRPVSFGWKDPALGSTTMGLIAQEAEPIVPELVARAQDKEGMLSLNYVGLVPVLIKAVQEQQAQKDAEIAALKAQNQVLSARLAALEQQMDSLLGRGGRQLPR